MAHHSKLTGVLFLWPYLSLLCVCVELVQVAPESKVALLPVGVQQDGLPVVLTLQVQAFTQATRCARCSGVGFGEGKYQGVE
jgi:hypothetical protein